MTDKEKNDVKLEVKKPSLAGDDKTAKIPKPNRPSMANNKVVMNASADSAIRPSDATSISPSPAAAPPGIEETIEMDRSEVKDVPEIAMPTKSADKTVKPPPTVSKTTKSKTIKLKPLKPVNAEEDNQEETLSMDRDALMDKDMPSSLGATASEPSLKDEATIKIKKPKSQKPPHPTPNIPVVPSAPSAPSAQVHQVYQVYQVHQVHQVYQEQKRQSN